MKPFLVHWAVTGASLAAAAYLLPGVQVTSPLTLVIAALALGLVNSVVRPILQFLALPLTVITFGVFALVVNAAAFGLAAFLVPGFTVSSFWSALFGTLIVSLVSLVLRVLLKESSKN